MTSYVHGSTSIDKKYNMNERDHKKTKYESALLTYWTSTGQCTGDLTIILDVLISIRHPVHIEKLMMPLLCTVCEVITPQIYNTKTVLMFGSWE